MSNLKLKIRSMFPALVDTTSPITLLKVGLAYTFGLDIAELRTSLDSVYAPVGLIPKTDPKFYAYDYGVRADGATYTTQMQNALNAVKAAGGGVLILPAGTVYTGALTYTSSTSPFYQGIQIEGQGQETSILRFVDNTGFMFTLDGTGANEFSAGVTFRKFQIIAVGTNTGGISLHQAAYANIEDMKILTTGQGVYGTSAGDTTSSFVVNVLRTRFDNSGTAGAFALDIFPSGTAVEYSQLRVESCQFEACGLLGVATTPTSGAIRWRGLIAEIVNCAFTTNNNTAIYIAKTGGAQCLTIDSCDFENTVSTVLPHVYCDTGIRLFKMSNCQFLNSDSFKCQGGVWFESTAGIQGNITIDGFTFRTSSGNNPYIAFKTSGTATNWMAETIRVRNGNWQTFDGTGQTRYSGNWQFDFISGQCQLSVSALNAVKLSPTGYGCTMPMRMLFGSGSSEIVAYQVPSAGITLSGIGGLGFPSQFLYFYLKNNATAVQPLSGILTVSTAGPTLDSSGYLVSSIDASLIYIGSYTTDAGQNFQTTAAGYSWYPPAQVRTGTGTLTIANGKTPVINNSITFAGTDATTVTFPVIDTNLASAWTVYTPTVTAASGTPTTVSATGRYKQIGKTVIAEMDVAVTTVGTASGNMVVSLPLTAAAFRYVGSSFDYTLSATGGYAYIATSSSTLFCRNAATTTYWASGANVAITITYEVP